MQLVIWVSGSGLKSTCGQNVKQLKNGITAFIKEEQFLHFFAGFLPLEISLLSGLVSYAPMYGSLPLQCWLENFCDM
jgi:hypothetical protein